MAKIKQTDDDILAEKRAKKREAQQRWLLKRRYRDELAKFVVKLHTTVMPSLNSETKTFLVNEITKLNRTMNGHSWDMIHLKRCYATLHALERKYLQYDPKRPVREVSALRLELSEVLNLSKVGPEDKLAVLTDLIRSVGREILISEEEFEPSNNLVLSYLLQDAKDQTPPWFIPALQDFLLQNLGDCDLSGLMANLLPEADKRRHQFWVVACKKSYEEQQKREKKQPRIMFDDDEPKDDEVIVGEDLLAYLLGKNVSRETK